MMIEKEVHGHKGNKAHPQDSRWEHQIHCMEDTLCHKSIAKLHSQNVFTFFSIFGGVKLTHMNSPTDLGRVTQECTSDASVSLAKYNLRPRNVI